MATTLNYTVVATDQVLPGQASNTSQGLNIVPMAEYPGFDPIDECNDSRIHALCYTSQEYVGYIYIIPTLATIGILFNLLNLIVFTRKTFCLTDSMLIFLTGLAVSDLMALILSLPSGFTRCFNDESASQSARYLMSIYDVYVYIPFNNTFGTASSFLTVIVALERYIYVVHSTFAKKTCTASIARTCLIMIFLLALLINLPFLFFRQVFENGHIETSDFGNTNGFRIFSWMRMFLVKFLPILTVAVLNFLLIKTVYEANKKVFPTNSRQRGRQQSQNRMTAMLLSITFVFLLCNILEPFAHVRIYEMIFGEGAKCTDFFPIFRMVMNVVEMISWTSNFASYCVFNRHFVYVLAMTCYCTDSDSRPWGQTGITTFSKTRNDLKDISLEYTDNSA